MQVCGGNAGQLLRAASAYTGDWDAGVSVNALSPSMTLAMMMHDVVTGP